MPNTRYNININYYPNYVTGWRDISISGATHTVQSYNGNWYTANIPELGISVTASSPEAALMSALLSASASSSSGNGSYLSNTRTW